MAKEPRCEIRVAGFGGQGIILAGYILGKAAAIYENKFATLTQSYGPESRGSACSAQVIIADTPILYPNIVTPDYAILMSQEAYHRFAGEVPEPGIILIDSDLINPDRPDSKVRHLSIPATAIAQNLGRKIVANIVMLGFFAQHANCISYDALLKAILATVPKEYAELNTNALKHGFTYKAGKQVGLATAVTG